MNTHDHTGPDTPYDLIGIGIGPANLSLAALAHPLPDLHTAFYDRAPAFHWHPGPLIEDTTLHTPFLADLVTLADPTNPFTYLNYLRHHHRLLPFHLAGRLHTDRAEHHAYCRWVSDQLPNLHYSHHIDTIRWDPEAAHFEIDHTRLDPHGEAEALGRTHAKNLALGTGTTPHIPAPLRPLAEAPTTLVLHSTDYLDHRDRLLAAGHITIVGSGQSGAEIFLDLLRRRPNGCEQLHWLTRTETFTAADHTTLALEHLTPDHTRHQLPPHTRQLHQGINPDTLAAIHHELYRRTLHNRRPDTTLTPGATLRTAGRIGDGRIELHLEHHHPHTRSRHTTDAVVLATGHRPRPLDHLLAALDPHLIRDTEGHPTTDPHHRLTLDPAITDTGSHIYLHGAPHPTHNTSTPDPALAAPHSATILNTLTGTNPYPQPHRTTSSSTTPGPTPTSSEHTTVSTQ